MPQAETQPTQQFVEIESVEDGVIFLKNGSLRQILLVAGVNFDLKSEDEQHIITAAYQNLINSLKFSLQIFVHSRRLNIESYLERLEERVPQEQNELLRNQITEYVQFVKSFVAQNPIMTKNFFVVVPFDPIIIPGAATAPIKKLFGIFGKASPIAQNPEEQARMKQEHKTQLAQRTSQVMASFSEVGLRAVPLQDEEVTELFYNLYNPESRERKVMMPPPTDMPNAGAKPVFHEGTLNEQIQNKK